MASNRRPSSSVRMSATAQAVLREAFGAEGDERRRRIDADDIVSAFDEVARDGLTGPAAEIENGRTLGHECEQPVEPRPLEQAASAVGVPVVRLALIEEMIWSLSEVMAWFFLFFPPPRYFSRHPQASPTTLSLLLSTLIIPQPPHSPPPFPFFFRRTSTHLLPARGHR